MMPTRDSLSHFLGAIQITWKIETLWAFAGHQKGCRSLGACCNACCDWLETFSDVLDGLVAMHNSRWRVSQYRDRGFFCFMEYVSLSFATMLDPSFSSMLSTLIDLSTLAKRFPSCDEIRDDMLPSIALRVKGMGT